jgi:hypothetical protein
MAKLMPGDIADEVREVLLRAPEAKSHGRRFLTTYQILDRLPPATRDRLIAERKLGGRGSGVYYAATGVVSDAAGRLPGVEIVTVDSKGLTIQVAGQTIVPGFGSSSLYRLKNVRKPASPQGPSRKRSK